jgi:hypothetical protein
MKEVADRPVLHAVLVEASNMTAEDRRARILKCVAEGRTIRIGYRSVSNPPRRS